MVPTRLRNRRTKRAEEELRKENIVLREELGKTRSSKKLLGTSSGLANAYWRASSQGRPDG